MVSYDIILHHIRSHDTYNIPFCNISVDDQTERSDVLENDPWRFYGAHYSEFVLYFCLTRHLPRINNTRCFNAMIFLEKYIAFRKGFKHDIQSVYCGLPSNFLQSLANF